MALAEKSKIDHLPKYGRWPISQTRNYDIGGILEKVIQAYRANIELAVVIKEVGIIIVIDLHAQPHT